MTLSATDYAKQHSLQFENQLVELLKIPSVSTLSEHAPDVERAAAMLVGDMKRIGMSARLFQEEGFLPIVYGEWLGAGEDAPTVLIYTHYDVQPAELADGWDTDPFTPTLKNGKLYARGAVDSKCHVIIQLKAIESLLATGGAPVNIKMLAEGEEESGSEHIFAFVKNNTALLKADACIVSDGSLPDVNQPLIVYGLRGLISLEVTVQGPRRDLHSGHYGGTVHNPIQALAEIMAKLHDEETGRVTVPGFYDGVRPLDEDERARLSGVLPMIEEEWKLVPNAPKVWGEPDFRLNERIGARPTLEFNGVYGGFQGEGVKTVIPKSATVKISCRLVPDQNPDQVLKAVSDYIREIAPPTVTLDIKKMEDGSPGILVDVNQPVIMAAAKAYAQAWGVEPLYSREGGSIPVVSEFQQALNVPIALMPFGYKGGGAHSTNEYVVVDMFHKGIQTMLKFYEIYAGLA